jgi:hypothetical protein
MALFGHLYPCHPGTGGWGSTATEDPEENNSSFACLHATRIRAFSTSQRASFACLHASKIRGMQFIANSAHFAVLHAGTVLPFSALTPRQSVALLHAGTILGITSHSSIPLFHAIQMLPFYGRNENSVSASELVLEIHIERDFEGH